MTIKEVRNLRECLIKLGEKKIEFIPMFTNMLLEMLDAYETEIESLESELDNAQDDGLEERE